MPGAADIVENMAFASNENVLMMRSKASLYSSLGVLEGLLTLYRDRLVWSEMSSRSSNQLTISMEVLFGATLSPPGKFKFKSFEAASATNLSIESSTHFTVYTIMAREGGKRPLCDTWSFKVDSEDESAMWITLLRCAIRPKLTEDEVNVLVFLNPVSGRRKAMKVFESIVRPIFEIGCTRYTLKITQSAGFAARFVENEDLSMYSSVVVVSGDGLLHEVLNGLLQRSDWPKHKALPIGVVPAGTGNGLAKSLDCIWPEQAAVAMVKAESRPMDIMSATLASGRTEYCFLSLTWGLMADIDIESETMRWAGSARLDLYGTVRVMNLRYYGGRLHYLPAAETEEGAIETSHKQGAVGGMVQGASANSSIMNLVNRTNQGVDDAWGLPPPSFSSPLVRHSPKLAPNQLAPSIQPAVTLHPTLTAGIQLPITEGSLPPRWKTIEGPFVQVIATNVPWLATDFLACQKARISDGTMDLVFSRNVSKWQMIPYMSSSAKDDYMNKDGIENIKARAFILEPTGLRTTSRSDASLHAIQHPQASPTTADIAANGRKSTSSVKSPGNGSSLRPLSVPMFSSLRIKNIGKLSGRNARSSSLQAPVPVRVRSEAYSSYHQQTVGKNSSLRVQGLTPPSMPANVSPDTTPHSAADVRPPANVVEAIENGNSGTSAPRPPAQAIFSLRSETELASMSVAEAAAASLTDAAVTAAAAPQVTMSPSSAAAASAESPAAPTDAATKPAKNMRGSDGGCRLVGEHGIVDLDGEQVELGPVKMECLANLVNVVCPPWLDETQCARVGTMPAPKIIEPIKGSLSREGSMLSFSNI
ncbi:hypothetical protein H4R99_000135 [Coemansia sp. RSA 1722]|nr:hypothetical protein GGF39_000522 [Coemansia sp. RSA 1721]KAJ2606709.1 hypothetical protein H4R99_000135 [Coemansia sp. RSA 1722]KAJ2639832.1 hypothetical protein GGF40_000514 [Coemansia sp. RSA 1286]